MCTIWVTLSIWVKYTKLECNWISLWCEKLVQLVFVFCTNVMLGSIERNQNMDMVPLATKDAYFFFVRIELKPVVFLSTCKWFDILLLSLSLFNCAAAAVADSKFIEHHIRNQKSKKTIYAILYVLYLIACVRACMLSFLLLIFTYAQFKSNMCSFSWFACEIWFILDWFCRNSTQKKTDIFFTQYFAIASTWDLR